MPLIFSYGTLQHEDMQLATFGRRLNGHPDDLIRFEPSLVKIEDPQVAARIGATHHANARFNGNARSRVPGMVFEIGEDELAKVDSYEAEFLYRRIVATLASGRRAWVYVLATDALPTSPT